MNREFERFMNLNENNFFFSENLETASWNNTFMTNPKENKKCFLK